MSMTPEKLTELEALETAAAPPTWREIQVITPHTPEHNLLVALRNSARDMFAALREAWRERDEARIGWCLKLGEDARHYRNLAIVLGAKPDQMLNQFDRELCEQGIDGDVLNAMETGK